MSNKLKLKFENTFKPNLFLNDPDVYGFIEELLRFCGFDDGENYIVKYYDDQSYFSQKTVYKISEEDQPVLVTVDGNPDSYIENLINNNKSIIGGLRFVRKRFGNWKVDFFHKNKERKDFYINKNNLIEIAQQIKEYFNLI